MGLETYIQEGRIRNGKELREILEAELLLRVGSCDLPLLGQVFEAASLESECPLPPANSNDASEDAIDMTDWSVSAMITPLT